MDEQDEISLIREMYALTPASERLDLAADRARYESAAEAFAEAQGSRLEIRSLGGVPCELHVPLEAPARGCVVYLHGGGYVLGSPRSHRHLVSELCRRSGCLVVAADYALAPEHPFPAGLNDAAAICEAARAEWADLPCAIAGDSAGGGLALALLTGPLRPMAKAFTAVAAISPWADLTCSSARYSSDEALDGSLNPHRLKLFSDLYRAGAPARHPGVSPLFAELRGLPPLLIQAGQDEILRDDAVALAEAVRAAGGDVTLELWDDVVHVWHWYWPVLSAGERAIGRVSGFLNAKFQGAGRRLDKEGVAV